MPSTARAPRGEEGRGPRGQVWIELPGHSASSLAGSQPGPLTVMAAPGDAAPDTRAGLRGAPSPPPLSAAGRRSSSPSLPRSCPGPFHPPIKLFFFFKLPGRTRADQWTAWKLGQTAAGVARGPMGARAGSGAWPYDGAGGWGGGQGGPGCGRRFAGRKGLRAGDSAGDGVGAGRAGRSAESLNAPARVMVASGQGATVARRTQYSTLLKTQRAFVLPREGSSFVSIENAVVQRLD